MSRLVIALLLATSAYAQLKQACKKGEVSRNGNFYMTCECDVDFGCFNKYSACHAEGMPAGQQMVPIGSTVDQIDNGEFGFRLICQSTKVKNGQHIKFDVLGCLAAQGREFIARGESKQVGGYKIDCLGENDQVKIAILHPSAGRTPAPHQETTTARMPGQTTQPTQSTPSTPAQQQLTPVQRVVNGCGARKHGEQYMERNFYKQCVCDSRGCFEQFRGCHADFMPEGQQRVDIGSSVKRNIHPAGGDFGFRYECRLEERAIHFNIKDCYRGDSVIPRGERRRFEQLEYFCEDLGNVTRIHQKLIQ